MPLPLLPLRGFARQLPHVLSEAVLVLVIEGLGISATPKIDYEYDYEHERTNWQAKRHSGNRGRGLEAGCPYWRTSKMRLKGVSVARRKWVKPARVTMSRMRASPACAPRAQPTSWASDACVHTSVETE
jgi:hypothetical protein